MGSNGQGRLRLLEAALVSAADGVVVAEDDGAIAFANEAARRLTRDHLSPGTTVGQLLSRWPLRYPDGRPIPFGESPLQRALYGETVLDFVAMVGPIGRVEGYLQITASPIRDDKGRVLGAISILHDVTHVGAMPVDGEGGRIAGSASGSAEGSQMAELDQLKDAFISVAAHELKTPVAVMKGYAQALLRTEDALAPQRRRMLEAIDRGANRIDRIVKELLDISRLQLGQLALDRAQIDLPALVSQTIDRVMLVSPMHRLRLLRSEPAMVEGDRDRLEQVIVNLLDNAVRYSPETSDVDVMVSVQGDEAVVAVKDYGVAIPQEKQNRIFQRFYRAHTGTPQDYGGMGVGLYISREIIARHGGRMWFQSKKGQGSTFYFSLPLERGNGGR